MATAGSGWWPARIQEVRSFPRIRRMACRRKRQRTTNRGMLGGNQDAFGYVMISSSIIPHRKGCQSSRENITLYDHLSIRKGAMTSFGIRAVVNFMHFAQARHRDRLQPAENTRFFFGICSALNLWRPGLKKQGCKALTSLHTRIT